MADIPLPSRKPTRTEDQQALDDLFDQVTAPGEAPFDLDMAEAREANKIYSQFYGSPLAGHAATNPHWKNALLQNPSALSIIGLEGGPLKHVDKDGPIGVWEETTPEQYEAGMYRGSYDPQAKMGNFIDTPIGDTRATGMDNPTKVPGHTAKHEGMHRGMDLLMNDPEFGDATKALWKARAGIPEDWWRNDPGYKAYGEKYDARNRIPAKTQHQTIHGLSKHMYDTPYMTADNQPGSTNHLPYDPDKFRQMAAQEPEFLRNVDGKWQFHNPGGNAIDPMRADAAFEYLAQRLAAKRRPGGPR